MTPTISLAFIIPKSLSTPERLRRIAAMIDTLDYPRGNFEVIFYILGTAEGWKKTESAPLVRIFYVTTGRIQALHAAVYAAHGDIVCFVDEGILLDRGLLKSLAIDFKDEELWVRFGAGYYAGRKKLLPWNLLNLQDIADERSFVALDALRYGHKIIGSPGPYYRKEILRIIYNLERLSMLQKLWLFWQYVRGK